MLPEEQNIVSQTEEMVKSLFLHEGSGHDWRHIHRVWQTAISIALEEKANTFIVSLIALLHDIADYKFHDGDEKIGGQKARERLTKLNVSESIIDNIQNDVDNISFKGGKGESPSSLEGRIVQDADRLDALGAIGIARAFAYGGKIQREIYDPLNPANPDITKEEYMKKNSSTINHFYDKILRVKDLMNTETGKKIATQRHSYVEEFLKRFYLEWDGKDLLG